jgi:hypothetical protein
LPSKFPSEFLLHFGAHVPCLCEQMRRKFCILLSILDAWVHIHACLSVYMCMRYVSVPQVDMDTFPNAQSNQQHAQQMEEIYIYMHESTHAIRNLPHIRTPLGYSLKVNTVCDYQFDATKYMYTFAQND